MKPNHSQEQAEEVKDSKQRAGYLGSCFCLTYLTKATALCIHTIPYPRQKCYLVFFLQTKLLTVKNLMPKIATEGSLGDIFPGILSADLQV